MTWKQGWSLALSPRRPRFLLSSHTLCILLHHIMLLFTSPSPPGSPSCWSPPPSGVAITQAWNPAYLSDSPSCLPPWMGSAFRVGPQQCKMFILFGYLTMLQIQSVLFILQPWRWASGPGAAPQPSALTRASALCLFCLLENQYRCRARRPPFLLGRFFITL